MSLVSAFCALCVVAAADSTERSGPAASREAMVRDWMLQDLQLIELPPDSERQRQKWREEHLKQPEAKRDDVVLARLPCFTSDGDAVVEPRMIRVVLNELTGPRPEIERELETLTGAGVPGRDPRWRRLYERACEQRRAQRLAPLLARWKRLVVAWHPHIPQSWKYTEVLSDAHTNRGRFYRPNAAIKVLELRGPYPTVRTLIDDRQGMIRDPDVSFDGERLLFAWKKSDRGDDFHLYEMTLATGAIRALTDGLGFADYEGVYLPDGNLLFSSTRCCQTVDCNWVEVSNLYLMDGDGRFQRRVGFDQVHTIFPTVTDDGRVLYTRWEYNDRGQIFPQPLFQMNPDGTNQQEFYGAQSWFPTNIIHARKIPGSQKVLAVVTGHHRPAHGKLAVIDPAVGRQEGLGLQLVAPIRTADYVQVDQYALDGNQFQYPYPLDEERFLVTLAVPTPDGKLGRFDGYFMDVHGHRELLIEGERAGDDGVGCKQILPLAPRPRPHVRPAAVDYSQTTGRVFLQDIYAGQGLAGVERGTIKRLRVVTLEYRAAAIGRLGQKGLGGASEVTTPVAVGNGSWDVKVVLGSVPVHADGSALFEAPARRPLYFQALDAKNRVVQTMRSWTTLMPGETQSCVGCHEHKNTAPRARPGVPLAMQAGVQRLTPFYGPPRGFSFAAEIQPILDQHCVRCHATADDPPPRLTRDLLPVADTKRRFSRSYLALTHAAGDCGAWSHSMVNWIDCMSEPAALPPYHRGSATSRLMTLLESGHEGVRLSQEEWDKFACWIDLLVPYCGDYREAAAWSSAEHAFYAAALAKRDRLMAVEQANLRALSELPAVSEAADTRQLKARADR